MIPRRHALLATALAMTLLAVLTAGCGDDNDQEVTPTPPGGGFDSTTEGDLTFSFETVRTSSDNAFVMFELVNESLTDDDALIGASSDVTGGYELQTIDADRVAETVPRIEVPANHTLQIGSVKVVLTELNRELSQGEAIDVTLEFERAGPVVLSLEVTGFTAP